MGDLFVILGIACMALYLWDRLPGSQQQNIQETAKNVHDSARDKIREFNQR